MTIFCRLVFLGVVLSVSTINTARLSGEHQLLGETKLLEDEILGGIQRSGKARIFGIFSNDNTNSETNDQVTIDEWGDNVEAAERGEIKWGWDVKWPSQIAMLNPSTKTGLVIDGTKGLVVLEEANGTKAALDIDRETATLGTSSTKTQEEFEDKFHDFNIVDEAKGTPEHPMVEEKPTYDAYSDTWLEASGPDMEDPIKEDEDEDKNGEKKYDNKLVQLLYNIFPGFVNLVKKINAKLIDFVPCSICKIIRIIKMMFAPIVWVLKLFSRIMVPPVLKGWLLFKNGLRAFINIFKWIYKFCNNIVRSISILVNNGVKFALNAVMGAANGALALYHILRAFASKINVMTIIRPLFNLPQLLCNLINGLGGMLSAGVTGLFGIISKLYNFTFGQVFDTLKRFVDQILDCISGGRPSEEDVTDAANKLGEVSRYQKRKYKTGSEFRTYDRFLQGLKGGDFEVKGLRISKLTSLLEDTYMTAKETVMKILNFMNPFAPMKSLIARLFVDTVLSLNTTTGPAYVKQLFPIIEFPDDALQGTNRNLAVDLILPESMDASIRNLPTTEMLRTLPIVKDIYSEFNNVALEYTNSTMEFLLNNQNVEELVEFTTTVMGLHK